MTRTSRTHSYIIKRTCQPYNYLPFTKRLYKATDSTAVTMGGTEVKSLSQQLESTDYRQMGSGLCAGFF